MLTLSPALVFIRSLDPASVFAYTKYWEELSPVSYRVFFERFLFAYASVHTTWQANVRLYGALQQAPLEILRDPHRLSGLIQTTRAGLHNNRAKYISDFSASFWEDPSLFMRGADETWVDYRNRIEQQLFGLGMAKTSFAVELLYPTTNQVLCLDTHMLQLYGLSGSAKLSRDAYLFIEGSWVNECAIRGFSPTMVRHLYWDRLKGKTDTRYWSSQLETVA